MEIFNLNHFHNSFISIIYSIHRKFFQSRPPCSFSESLLNLDNIHFMYVHFELAPRVKYQLLFMMGLFLNMACPFHLWFFEISITFYSINIYVAWDSFQTIQASQITEWIYIYNILNKKNQQFSHLYCYLILLLLNVNLIKIVYVYIKN